MRFIIISAYLHQKLQQVQQINSSLKEKAEKERVDQYAVYLELLAAEGKNIMISVQRH